MAHRVVITGIGPVTSVGIGVQEFFSNLWRQEPAISEIPVAFSRSYPFHSRWYVPLPQISLAAHHLDLANDRIMQPKDRMLVLAARLALEDAGYEVEKENTDYSARGLADASIIVGTGMASLQTALESHLSHCLPRALLSSAVPERRSGFSRMVVTKSMPNSPAAWVSICFGLHGTCSTLNASCASGTYAVGEAFRRIKDGYDKVVLAGGVEALQDADGFIMRGFDVLGVLTQSPDGQPGPFGKPRSGFLFAEGGACMLVLEEFDHARQRNAPIYAEIARFTANSDACSILQIDLEGKQMLSTLRQLASGRSIQYVNAHGTGTVANDEVEAEAIRTVFGERASQPFINSTKGILGHTLGASGAIEVAVTALSIARGTIHGNVTREPMDGLNLPLDAVHAPIENAITVSFGFGGHNGGLLLTKSNASQTTRFRADEPSG